MHHAQLDLYACGDSWFHRLDSRVKTLVALGFTVYVVTLDRMDPVAPWVYGLGPFAILMWTGVSHRFLATQCLWVSPFVVTLAVCMVLTDARPAAVHLGIAQVVISAGALRAATVVSKFLVTYAALLALMTTTRFGDLLAGLQRLHLPQALVVQLGLLYRYLHVLTDTAGRRLRARRARQCRRLPWRQELHVAGCLLGSLLLGSLDAAERSRRALEARGFTGTWPMARPRGLDRRDGTFALVTLAFVAAVHWGLLPRLH